MTKKPFDLFDYWCETKKKAIKAGDYEFYRWFLLEIQKEWIKRYVKAKIDEEKELAEQMLEIASCELRRNNIKYKESKVPF